MRREVESLLVERQVGAGAQELGVDAFRVPEVRASGSVAEWDWVGYEVIGKRPHAPARAVDRDLLACGSSIGRTHDMRLTVRTRSTSHSRQRRCVAVAPRTTYLPSSPIRRHVTIGYRTWNRVTEMRTTSNLSLAC